MLSGFCIPASLCSLASLKDVFFPASLQFDFARDFGLHGAVSLDVALWFRCPVFVSYDSKSGKRGTHILNLGQLSTLGPVIFGLSVRI